MALAFFLLVPSASMPSSSVSFLTEGVQGLGLSPELATGSRVEFVCNVLIIVPAVFLGSLLWPSWNWRDWTCFGFLFSGSIELFQGLFLPERSAMFSDVVANTCGAFLGAVSSALFGAWLLAPGTGRRLRHDGSSPG